MSEDTTPDEVIEEETPMPQITANAHASASVGITIIVGGKSAWPKAEFSDNALPGETSEELIARINNLALDMEFDLAEKTRYMMQNELNTTKKDA